MAIEKTFMEESTAPGTGAGFDYQFHYFIYRLLNMKKGQSIGLEIKDDVHTDMDNVQLLFQLKHTIQTQADGNPIALTELDLDLWKTLYNWARVISDPKDDRAEKADQLTFVRRTEFHLVSNKSESSSNKFGQLLSTCTEYPSSENLKAVIDCMEGLASSTKDTTIKGYIDTVLALHPQVREEFLKRIFFQLAEVAIVQKIKQSLLEKFVHPDKIESTYHRLHGLIRDDNYFSVLDGKLTAIKFDDFATRYRKVFLPSEKQTLSRPSFQPVLPKNLLDQRFIRQLIAIEDFHDTDMERIAQLSTHRVRMARRLMYGSREGTSYQMKSKLCTMTSRYVGATVITRHSENAIQTRSTNEPWTSLMPCERKNIDWAKMNSTPRNPTGNCMSSRNSTPLAGILTGKRYEQ